MKTLIKKYQNYKALKVFRNLLTEMGMSKKEAKQNIKGGGIVGRKLTNKEVRELEQEN